MKKYEDDSLLEELLKIYQTYRKCNYYVLGFEYEGTIYAVALPEIPEHVIYSDTASRNGGRSLRVHFNDLYKKMLVTNGWATPLCTQDSLVDIPGNKGEKFEITVANQMFGENREKIDRSTWDKGADIVHGNLNVECKFEGGTIITERQALDKIEREERKNEC